MWRKKLIAANRNLNTVEWIDLNTTLIESSFYATNNQLKWKFFNLKSIETFMEQADGGIGCWIGTGH